MCLKVNVELVFNGNVFLENNLFIKMLVLC